MAGEMTQDDVTREGYPLHFGLADALGGTVVAFDTYQGPYIQTPNGKFWLVDGGDGYARWYNEQTNNFSERFVGQDANLSLYCAKQTYTTAYIVGRREVHMADVLAYGNNEDDARNNVAVHEFGEVLAVEKYDNINSGEFYHGGFTKTWYVRKAEPSDLWRVKTQPEFDDASKAFAHTPSATNWLRLQRAMVDHQEAFNVYNDENERLSSKRLEAKPA